MRPLVLKLQVTTEYLEHVNIVKEKADLRKCRCWMALQGITQGVAQIEVNQKGIVLRGESGSEDFCTYDAVLCVTEMRNGILLRLSHKRLLWLPVTEDRDENAKLMQATNRLCECCKCVLREGHLRLPGVGLPAKVRYHLRPKRGYYMGDGLVKVAWIFFIAFTFFVGTVFLAEPLQNEKIFKNEAISYQAHVADVKATHNRYGIREIALTFSNGDEFWIDVNCSTNPLFEQLKSIPRGTQLQLLLRPNDKTILQIEYDGKLLLEFEDAQQKLWNSAVGMAVLGLFMYASGIVFLCLRPKKLRRKGSNRK